jgi:hypothetical protein
VGAWKRLRRVSHKTYDEGYARGLAAARTLVWQQGEAGGWTDALHEAWRRLDSAAADATENGGL